MRNFSTFVLCCLSLQGFSQLYVSPSSYVYVNDQTLFVRQDINLQNNGNIFLRNESQLLQGTTGASANTGQGKLSVFQEGTSDNFDYNYWCSPVGDPVASPGNSNFGITMLNMPTSLIASSPAVMLGTSVLDGFSAPLSIAQRWVFKYINSNNYSQWVQVNAATNIAPGEGFTMKGTSGTDATSVEGEQNNPGSAQRYDFRGKPNDGNISVTVGVNNMTLTGNPYPSALHVNAFLLDPTNVAVNATAYYWEQNKSVNSHFLTQYQGGYGTYSPVSLASNGIYVAATFDTYDGAGNLNAVGTPSGLVINRKYAPIGQGFMVEGAANGVVTLRNSHRDAYRESDVLSQFERSANPATATPSVENVGEPVSHIRINAIFNDQYTKQLALAFVPEATDGIDRGIDSESPSADDLPNDVYFDLEDKKFVIEGIAWDASKRVPIGIKAANNTAFRFYVPAVFSFDEEQDVFLYDALDNSYHNIKTGFYDITLDAGIYENRFEITFTDAALATPVITKDTFDIVQNNDTQQLSISNPEGFEIKSCILYDMAGKQVFKKLDLGNDPQYHFATSGISEGVYIVKLVTSTNQDFGKKVNVFRTTN